jgi:hypothetical protein
MVMNYPHRKLVASVQPRLTADEQFTRLNANLREIKLLNPQLYEQVFANVDFELWLDQMRDRGETAMQQEWSHYRNLIREFYEELALRQLAPIACAKRRQLERTKRMEFLYEYLPIVSLIVATLFFRLWMGWGWSLIAALFAVGPLMIWIAHPMRCEFRTWSEEMLLKQQSKLDQGWCELSEQETQVLHLLSLV